MSLLFLAIIFLSIVVMLRLKQPLYRAILTAMILTVLLFQLPLETVSTTLIRSATSTSTLSILLIFYLIAYLQRMLESRGSLTLAKDSLDHLFLNRRMTVALAPMLLGTLPSASIILISGDIVEKSVGDYMTKEEKAFVASYYRHIPESFLPTYTSIILAISLTNDRVSVGNFILAMMPVVVMMLILGHFFFLRRIPKTPVTRHIQSKRDSFIGLLKGSWPILLMIFLIMAFNLPVYAATAISVGLFILTGRFKPYELTSFLRSAFEHRLLVSIFFIMLFKDVLSATGVVETLPDILGTLPLPTFVIYSLIFFFGTLVSGIQAMVVIGIPLVFLSMPEAGLPLFILLMGMGYIGNMLTPTHVCLPIISEYYQIDFSQLVKQSLPIFSSLGLFLFGYYWLLLMFS